MKMLGGETFKAKQQQHNNIVQIVQLVSQGIYPRNMNVEG